MRKALLILIIPLITLNLSCSGRLPQNETTTKVLRKHFNKYGKNYPESPFGHKKVTQIEILEVKEIRKHLVYTIAFVTIEGPEVFKVRVTLEKGPFGWRYVAWENLSGQN